MVQVALGEVIMCQAIPTDRDTEGKGPLEGIQ